MSKIPCLLASLLLAVLSANTYAADLAAIYTRSLPQEAAILTALDDASQLEPYSQSFTGPANWNYPSSAMKLPTGSARIWDSCVSPPMHTKTISSYFF